jgi:hypothetical protein
VSGCRLRRSADAHRRNPALSGRTSYDRCRFGVALLAVGTALLFPSAAAADLKRVTDPNDAPGYLDVRHVEHSDRLDPASGAVEVTHSITTFATWWPRNLARGGRIVIMFDTRGGPAPERKVQIVARRGRLAARIYDETKMVDRVRVGRTGPRNVVVRMPATALGDGVTAYRWYASTGTPCGQDEHVGYICADDAPAQGRPGNPGRIRYVTHSLPKT